MELHVSKGLKEQKIMSVLADLTGMADLDKKPTSNLRPTITVRKRKPNGNF